MYNLFNIRINHIPKPTHPLASVWDVICNLYLGMLNCQTLALRIGIAPKTFFGVSMSNLSTGHSPDQYLVLSSVSHYLCEVYISSVSQTSLIQTYLELVVSMQTPSPQSTLKLIQSSVLGLRYLKHILKLFCRNL